MSRRPIPSGPSDFALSRYGVSTEDVRAALQASNPNRPKGTIEGSGRQLQIYTGAGKVRRIVDAFRQEG